MKAQMVTFYTLPDYWYKYSEHSTKSLCTAVIHAHIKYSNKLLSPKDQLVFFFCFTFS